MGRRLIIAVMLFVLLWTGTLLHDIAEPDESAVVQSQVVAKMAEPIAQAVGTAELSTVEHCHDALLVCKPRVGQTIRELPQIAVIPYAALWTSRPTLFSTAVQRGPPPDRTKAGPKLFLTYRALLI